MKRTVAILIAVVLVAALNGCNTARGFGQDVEKLGSVISRAAHR